MKVTADFQRESIYLKGGAAQFCGICAVIAGRSIDVCS